MRTCICPNTFDLYGTNFSGEKHIPIERNSCGDPVKNDLICEFLNEEICLCSDNDLRPFLCRHYCAGDCGPVKAVNCTIVSSLVQPGSVLTLFVPKPSDTQYLARNIL